MLSLYCVSSMLPCGRYYYEPEGGYVGNPWVKFSYQYMYLYLAWFLHHLDLIEHYAFQFVQTFYRQYSKLYTKAALKSKYSKSTSLRNIKGAETATIKFENTNYNNSLFNPRA
jgi:hypothetical protein